MISLHDIRFAIRSLSRVPGFTIAVVMTLALGIGANTAIFSVVRGALLRPLPNRDGDRLVYLRQSATQIGQDNVLFSVPEIIDYRTGSTALRGFAEYSEIQATMLGHEDPVRVLAGVVTGNYFDVMGLGPVAGRLFDSRDDGPGAAPAMVLTQAYWLQRFGGDRDVIGRSVRLNGSPILIVGVVQDAPRYPGVTDVFVNMVTSPHHLSATMVTGRTHRMTEVFARLAPGATMAQASAELDRISANVYADHPETYERAAGYSISVTPLREVMNERATLTFWLLMGAAGFVFLIACANVANLTLIRGIRRERELIVRRAMGAGVARIRRLLLAENLLLATAGGALGLVIAYAGLGVLVAFAEQLTTRGGEIRLDGAVLAFTIAVTIAVAIVLAFVPNVGAEGSLAASLASAGKRTTAGRGRQRMQRSLVVVQVAVSVVLLTGAGLLVRTLMKLQVVDTGVGVENVLTMEVPMDGTGRSTAEQLALYEQMRDRIAALPGVIEAGLGSNVPLRGTDFRLDIKAEGRPVAPGEPTPNAEYRTASPEYFRAAGIPLVRGREFATTDRQGTARVVILNQTLARRLFEDRDPIGQRVAWTGDVLRFIPVSGEWRTVVGVVGDTRDAGLDADPSPVLFQPFAQEEIFSGAFIVRTGADPAALGSSVEQTIRSFDPQALVENVLTLEQVRDDRVAPRRVNTLLVTSFGALALVIAAVGIAGVLAFSVSSRTGEIAIRMSLGADPFRVKQMILGEGWVLLAIGLMLGVAGSLAASRLLETLLYGVTPGDPLTVSIVALTMATVGTLACWIPAARAARVQPAVALRAE
ncbi:MAG: ABC transporter permease [Gemmatimonadaceae bacterium]